MICKMENKYQWSSMFCFFVFVSVNSVYLNKRCSLFFFNNFDSDTKMLSP